MTKKIVRRPSSRPDLLQFERWAELCWAELEGQVIVQCVPGKSERHHATETLLWPFEREQIEAFIVEHLDCGRIHATTVLRDPDHASPRVKDACLHGFVCWADIDIALPLDEIRQRLGKVPAAIVETGGPGHHHVYVPLDMPHPPEDIQRGNEALRRLLEADAAQSPAKFLAIPGTFNHKYAAKGTSPEVTLLSIPDEGFISIEDLIVHCDRHSAPSPRQRSSSNLSRSVSEALPDWLVDVIGEPAGAKRGGQAYHAVMSLMEYGLCDDEIRFHAREVPAIVEKFEGRVDEQVDTLISKGRQFHDHPYEDCAQARCPNRPDWMDKFGRPLPYQPPMSLADFLSQDIRTEWLIDGLLPHRTSGMIAGPAKSFKSFIGLDLALSVGTGTDFLGRFRVGRTGPVLLYLNEGSMPMHIERLRRLQRAHGVRSDDAPIHLRTNTANCDSTSFLPTLQRDLSRLEPVLVILDPWYGFHGTQTDVSNLMSEGALLRRVEHPCIDAGATLLIANHFAKNAREPRLTSITQSGGAEWCDSWILSRTVNDTGSDASLEARFGGRGSGGEQKFIVHARGGMLAGIDQPFRWEVRTPSDNFREAILEVLEDNPEGLGKSAIRRAVTGQNERIDAALTELEAEGRLVKGDRNKYFVADE